LGTAVNNHESLMSAGLDSIAATELVQALSVECGLEISPTMVFDHPTVFSVASLL
jgi:acyl carrier protein